MPVVWFLYCCKNSYTKCQWHLRPWLRYYQPLEKSLTLSMTPLCLFRLNVPKLLIHQDQLHTCRSIYLIFFFVVLLLFMCSLSETCDWVFNFADSFSLRQRRFGNLGVTPHWLDYVHGIHTLVFLLDNYLWCLIMFLWTLIIRSGDSTARIWAIGDVACSSSMENGTSGVLVLKHFKGRANEKSKDVTTLDWNVSSYFHYFYTFSKSVKAAFFPVLLSQFS